MKQKTYAQPASTSWNLKGFYFVDSLMHFYRRKPSVFPAISKKKLGTQLALTKKMGSPSLHKAAKCYPHVIAHFDEIIQLTLYYLVKKRRVDAHLISL